jgi:hypothetical protein
MKRLSKEERETHKRFSKRRFERKVRKARRKYRFQNPPTRPREEATQSAMLDLYTQQAEMRSVRRVKDRVEAPAIFSFIDNPDSTVGFLENFVLAVRGHPRVFVDQAACTHVEICAVSVLNALAMEARLSLETRYRGSYPQKSLSAAETIVAAGLPKQIGVPLPQVPKVEALGLIHKAEPGVAIDSSSRKEQVAEQVIGYLEGLLRRKQFALSAWGKKKFQRLITEVLGNAEEHSGQRDWYVSSFLRRPTEEGTWECGIVIFNFGRSIKESLEDLPQDATLRRELKDLQHSHRARYGRNWQPEDLWTVCALQQGVSRKNTETGDILGDNGYGTVEMIEAFQALGRTTESERVPMMCLLSGSTHVLFDGRFQLADVNLGGGQARKVIAFNEANDVRQPPVDGVVTHLRHKFPGTLISLRFYLDRGHLSKIQSEYGQVRN